MWYTVNPHQRCGYSHSPFTRKDTLLYSGSRNGLEGLTTGASTHKNKLTLRKHHFVIEKYVEVKQDEKHTPNLLGLITKAPGLVVKEEVQRILCKINQFEAKITKIRVSTF